MSPELARGNRIIFWKKADTWSLGIILYLMLFQQYPPWIKTLEDGSMGVVLDRYYDFICVRGNLEAFLEMNGINYLPVHALLQNILRANPLDRWSTDIILDWFDEAEEENAFEEEHVEPAVVSLSDFSEISCTVRARARPSAMASARARPRARARVREEEHVEPAVVSLSDFSEISRN